MLLIGTFQTFTLQKAVAKRAFVGFAKQRPFICAIQCKASHKLDIFLFSQVAKFDAKFVLGGLSMDHRAVQHRVQGAILLLHEINKVVV